MAKAGGAAFEVGRHDRLRVKEGSMQAAEILARWPASGLWVIGLFIGVDLIFYGLAWVAIALGLRGA
jgi:hypothetical protein